MPWTRIYHPNTVLQDPAERDALSNAITDLYEPIKFPRFWVGVIFVPLEPSSIYMGGKAQTKWVRLAVEHALGPAGTTDFDPFVARYEAAIKPFIRDKGIAHELTFAFIPLEPWRINGMKPPTIGTPAHRKWLEENKPSAYDEADGRL